MQTFYHKTERRTTRSQSNPDPKIWADSQPENWGDKGDQTIVADTKPSDTKSTKIVNPLTQKQETKEETK